MSLKGWLDDLQAEFQTLAPEDAVHRLLDFAVDQGMSDLFFLTCEDHMQVAGRHLGLLRPLLVFASEFGRHCLGYMKAAAGLDLMEKRHPIDGRWLTERKGHRIDLRISTIPTLYGEDFTVRLLVRDSMLLQLDALGLW